MKSANSKKNGYQSDDDNIKYKINTKYFNSPVKPPKSKRQENDVEDDEDNIRYKFSTALTKKPEPKPKSKIKVNFWSNKQSGSRLHNTEKGKPMTYRRHTVGIPQETTSDKAKTSVKVRKRVSFLPSPVISENHVPMVTVPDDLTVQFNEEEANTLRDDLNQAFFNSNSSVNDKNSTETNTRSRTSLQSSPRVSKRKRSLDDSDPKANENELEFFTKYVVQKLRRMETDQRIYSENLINTVLMLGQLRKLNGKSKIAEAQ